MVHAANSGWLVAIAWGCATAVVCIVLTEGTTFIHGEPPEPRNYIGSLTVGLLLVFLLWFDNLTPHGSLLGLLFGLVLVGVAAYARYRSQSF